MDKIFLTSDIHGSFKPIRELHKRLKDNNIIKSDSPKDNIMILLGDTGVNYYLNKRDDELKEKLSIYPFTYFLIRGNHEQRPSICARENSKEWHLEQFWDSLVWVENKYPNIKYAQDCVSCYNIPYKDKIYKTVVIPGAFSVDKEYRLLLNHSWFPDEQLSKSEKISGLRLLENNECDLILSHTCPCNNEPTDLYLPNIDQSKVDKGMESYLEIVKEILEYKVWCFGHFHANREYDRNAVIPSLKDPRMLMLFNDCAVELDNIMNDEKIYFL